MNIKVVNLMIRVLILFVLIILALLLLQIIQLISNHDMDDSFLNSHSPIQKYSHNPISVVDTNGKKRSFVAGNCVFLVDNRIGLLYYTLEMDRTAVYFALSDDGAQFKDVTEDPVLDVSESGWDAGSVSVFPNCIVKKRDGNYLLYYTGTSSVSKDIYHDGKIGVAQSSDLLQWKKNDVNPILSPSDIGWDSLGVFEGSVDYTGNTFGVPDAYKMWYGGSDNNLRFQIGYATSSNGVIWEKNTANPVLSYSTFADRPDSYSVEVHSVNRIFGKYVMFYEGVGSQFPDKFLIGIAHSNNGIKWTKQDMNTLLSAGPVGSWDQMGAYHPSYIEYKGKSLLYYTGLDSEFNHLMGLSILSPETIISSFDY